MGWHKGNIWVERLNSFSAASNGNLQARSQLSHMSKVWILKMSDTALFYVLLAHSGEKQPKLHRATYWRNLKGSKSRTSSCESCNNVGLQLHAQFLIAHSVVHLQFICRVWPVTWPISKPRAKDKISFGKETLVPSKWVRLWGQEKCHDLDQNV